MRFGKCTCFILLFTTSSLSPISGVMVGMLFVGRLASDDLMIFYPHCYVEHGNYLSHDYGLCLTGQDCVMSLGREAHAPRVQS
jgi:hypothetical protein